RFADDGDSTRRWISAGDNSFTLNFGLVQLPLSPLHRLPRPRALRAQFQRFSCISERVLRVLIRSDEDEPRVLEVRGGERGLFAEHPRAEFIAAAQGIPRFRYQVTCQFKVWVH